MSEEEKQTEVVDEEVDNDDEEEVPVGEETPEEALRTLLTQAQNQDTLYKGLHESCRQIEKSKAALCILAMDCDSDQYKNLITFLCKEKEVPLFKIDSRLILGELCGLCRVDDEDNVRKVRKTSCAVVKWLPESTSTTIVLEHIKNGQ